LPIINYWTIINVYNRKKNGAKMTKKNVLGILTIIIPFLATLTI